jgi:1-phosphatidylinositol-3-phosphate 5-kinase
LTVLYWTFVVFHTSFYFLNATIAFTNSLRHNLERFYYNCYDIKQVNIQNAVSKNGNLDQAVYKLLSLNRLLWELLLESCIWDRRLHSLLSGEHTAGDSNTKVMQEQVRLLDGPAAGSNDGTETILENGNVVFDDSANLKVKLDTSVEANGFPIKEIPVEGPVQESSDGDDVFNTSTVAEGEMPTLSLSTNKSSDQECAVNGSVHCQSGDDNCQAVILSSSDHSQMDRTIPISTGLGNADSISDLHVSKKDKSLRSLSSSLENSIEWPWTPFSEIRQIGMKDLLKGYLKKFGSISHYTPEYIPTAYQLIIEEGSRLHIPLETDNYIVSDYDGELSSIIACALASLNDVPVPSEVLDEDNKRGMATKSFESLHSLARSPAITYPLWSSNGSSDSDSVYSTPSISLEDPRFSSFDGLNLLDSLVPPEPFNPVVNLLGKGKYTVACLYANEFRDLRHRCCPSEVDYIASLSRCRNWDAKGGKSKSFFAKTLDDRFIIKEIKKTEFDSFMKFARDYFKYMNQSFELGNQTCLAKVLGIYQVCCIDFPLYGNLASMFLAFEFLCR